MSLFIFYLFAVGSWDSEYLLCLYLYHHITTKKQVFLFVCISVSGIGKSVGCVHQYRKEHFLSISIRAAIIWNLASNYHLTFTFIYINIHPTNNINPHFKPSCNIYIYIHPIQPSFLFLYNTFKIWLLPFNSFLFLYY
jgi:hypothetical protein